MQGWIFSRKVDIWVFVSPLLAVLVIQYGGVPLGLDENTNLGVDIPGLPPGLRLGFFVNFLYAVTLDTPHALATLFRVYADKQEFRRLRTLYLLLPIATWILLFAAAWANNGLLFRAVSYLNIFHFIRQQYGWMRLTRHKAGESDKQEAFLDAIAIYAATLVPVLWWHATPTEEGWLYPGDLVFFLPPVAATLTHSIFLGVSLVYLSWQFQKLLKGEAINHAKLLVWGSTVLAWYGGIVWNLARERSFLLDFLHALPYLVLVFHFGKKRASPFRHPILFQSSLILFALGIWFLGAREGDPAPGLTTALVSATVLLFPVLHYLMDTWLWRTSKKTEVAQVLELKATRDGVLAQ